MEVFCGSAQRIYYDAVASCIIGNVKEEKDMLGSVHWNQDGSMKEGIVTRNTQMLPIRVDQQGVHSTYTYDYRNRLKESCIYYGDNLSQKEEYTYTSDIDLLPKTIVITYPDGESVSLNFEYINLDSHGNWVECIVTQNRRGKVTTRKKTRELTYWD